MFKSLLYFLVRGNWRQVKIHSEILFCIYKLKFIKWINRLYKKVWPFIFSFWILTVLTWGTLQFKHDYDLIHNYAHIDALNQGIYSTWRTDGNPGQDPPKK